ncbi:MAG TPA: tetratricopeptide repeat protein [Bryocella sp.]|nr:tetratricopeptide repeat protein [Bryocella sp.]
MTQGPPSSSRKSAFALAALLAIATAALYARVDRYDFVNYDDTLYVTQNTHVLQGLTWETVRWAFTTYRVGTWHPLTWLSHALDCQLFDLDAAGPHDVNLLLHILNAVVLFWLLWRATGFPGRSFMVAALFALHPINVESVVWIAERKNSLSLLFFLLALAAYPRYVRQPKPRRYCLVAVLFALGLMSKPQVITFPFVLLLWDYWPLRRIAIRSSPFAFRRNDSRDVSGEQRIANSEERSSGEPPIANSEERSSGEPRRANGEWRSLLFEKLPLFALAGVSAAITMAAQRADGNKMWYPLSLRIEYAVVSYVQYLGKAFWPVKLSPFYPHPDSVNVWHAAGAALLLIAITVAVVACRRTRPYLLVGWFFFLGTLVPMLGLEGVGYQGKQGIADRYAYLPFIGLFLMICWGVAELAERIRVSPWLVKAASIALLIALAIVSYRQIGYWRDNVTLWSHALDVTQNNFLAENNLGRALLQQGQVSEGVAHFYRAAEIYPDDPVSNFNIGLYEQKQGNYSAAIARFQKTLAITRDPELRAAAAKSLAAAYDKLGRAPGHD